MSRLPTFPGDRNLSSKRHIHSYKNPHAYRETPKQTNSRPFFSLRFIKIVLVIAIIFLIYWIFFYSPLFMINNIEIKGTPRLETLEAIKSLSGKNIWLIGDDAAEETIRKNEPSIKEIRIIRGIPSTVVVNFIERETALVWSTEGREYSVDKDGIIFETTEDIPDNVPMIVDEKNVPVSMGSKITTSYFVETCKQISSEFAKVIPWEIESFSIPDTTYQMTINTQGPDVKINLNNSLVAQKQALEYVLNERKDSINEYIDVRIEGIAYIK